MYYLFSVGCLEVPYAKSSYCPSTSFQPGPHPHTPQSPRSHYRHHREQHYNPIYSRGNHQWSASKCHRKPAQFMPLFLCLWKITKDPSCFRRVSGSLQQLTPPDASKHSDHKGQCSSAADRDPRCTTPDLHLSFTSRYVELLFAL